MDVYNFGGLVLEVFTNGRVVNVSEFRHGDRREALMRRVSDENGVVSNEDVKSVVEVALMCSTSRPSERPSMQDALKLLPKLK